MYLTHIPNSIYKGCPINNRENKTLNKYYYTKPQEQPNFKGIKTKVQTNPLKKIIPGATAAILSIFSCKISNTKNREAKDIEGISVEYFDTRKDTQTAIENAIADARLKCTNSDFMEKVEVSVTKNFSSIDGDTPFRKYIKGIKNNSILGSSFYTDSCLPKQIVVQESPHTGVLSCFSGNNNEKTNNSLRFTLMHEFGHHFDKYYGHDHNADFAIAYDQMLARMSKKDSLSVFSIPTERKDMEITYRFNMEGGLSDKKEFKEAFKKDLENIVQIKRTGQGTLSKNIRYFTTGIDFTQRITDDLVDIKDALRAEVYANLFSYGIGENDGDREAFLSNFSNSFEVVKNDMKKHIGVI